ncbi:MAG: hypothetical protein R2912_04765 [Eubacteriales bacterium]
MFTSLWSAINPPFAREVEDRHVGIGSQRALRGRHIGADEVDRAGLEAPSASRARSQRRAESLRPLICGRQVSYQIVPGWLDAGAARKVGDAFAEATLLVFKVTA